MFLSWGTKKKKRDFVVKAKKLSWLEIGLDEPSCYLIQHISQVTSHIQNDGSNFFPITSGKGWSKQLSELFICTCAVIQAVEKYAAIC